MEDLGKVQCPKVRENQENSQEEPEISHAVDDEGLLARVGGRIFLEPETDQQIGTEPNPFPANEHQQKIVGQNEIEHHEHKEIEIGEVTWIPGVSVHVAN